MWIFYTGFIHLFNAAPILVFVKVQKRKHSKILSFNGWDTHIVQSLLVRSASLKRHLHFSMRPFFLKWLNACAFLGLPITPISSFLVTITFFFCHTYKHARCCIGNKNVCCYLWIYAYALWSQACTSLSFFCDQHSVLLDGLWYFHVSSFYMNFTLWSDILYLMISTCLSESCRSLLRSPSANSFCSDSCWCFYCILFVNSWQM